MDADIPPPELTAVVDQLEREHQEIARLVSSYYHKLIGKGVPATHAVMLAGSYQRSIFNSLDQYNGSDD